MSKPYSTAGFERREYSVGGVRTVVYSAGQGPPVVYLHGGGTFHGFEFARDWIGRFQVFLPYHPGFGESDDDPTIDSMSDYVLHYLELFDLLGLSRVHLVGASFGGRLAAEFAISHSQRLQRLVLVAPAGLSSPQHPPPDFRSIPPAELPSYLVHDLRVIRPFWPEIPSAEFIESRGRESRSVGRVAAGGSLESRILARWLHRVTVPTLLIWGREDRIIPAGLAAEWHRRLPRSTVVTVENAGHLLLDESTAARTAVRDFLS
jgi:pimeloyl-ACP methyl ester carboxylesterase